MDRVVMPINIAGRWVGPGSPCFVIAEAGVNHNGRGEIAQRLIDIAAEAGADAVKFQNFNAERLAAATAPKAEYQVTTTGADESQLEMLHRLELSPEATAILVDHCGRRGIAFLSTPFDEASADLLDTLGVPAFKIASGEITNLPFLIHVARKAKPMIVSTGMSDLAEVEAAVRAVRDAGNRELVLLHCVSNYPADPADANLRAMHTMASVFDVPVGYSDHTRGNEVALAAVALGACVIEKHFTTDRALPGPDHRASLEPHELLALVRAIRTVEAALGHGRKERAPSEANTAAVARRSLVARCDIAPGTVIAEAHVALLRPGTGLPPAMLSRVLGRHAQVHIPAGALLSLEMLA